MFALGSKGTRFISGLWQKSLKQDLLNVSKGEGSVFLNG
jgi:hypothetical protein